MNVQVGHFYDVQTQVRTVFEIDMALQWELRRSMLYVKHVLSRPSRE